MKAFKINNIEKVKQEVNLPAGIYTYSFRVLPVGTSYTFRLDNQSFTFEGLTAGVLNKRMKYTFELTETASFFYLSNTIGDCVYEPQIEEGVFATTPGAHALDFERLISETGIDIDSEVLSLYAKKPDVSAEIKIQTDRIDSTVGNISNDIDGIKSDVTTISQTATSIQTTVTNHTSQITTFQQTVDKIYTEIKDVGSGEFSSIIQRLDEIEIIVGADGQKGSIQLALDSIALTVYDESTGISAINLKVDEISLTVEDNEYKVAELRVDVEEISGIVRDLDSGEYASITTRIDEIELKVGAEDKEGSIQVEVDKISLTVYDANTGMSAINLKVDEISLTVEDNEYKVAELRVDVEEISGIVRDLDSGEYASIITRLKSIELKVGAEGKEGSIQVEVDSVTTRVDDIDFGFAEVFVEVGRISLTVYDKNTGMSAINQKVDEISLTVEDNEDKVAELLIDVNRISSTVYDEEEGMSAIVQKVNSITSTVYDEHGALLSKISQNGTDILIKGSQIDLEGVVTANDNFKVLMDGSIEATSGKIGGLTIKDGKLLIGNVGDNRIELDPSSRRISFTTYDDFNSGSIGFDATGAILNLYKRYSASTVYSASVSVDGYSILLSRLGPTGNQTDSATISPSNVMVSNASNTTEVKADGIYKNGIKVL